MAKTKCINCGENMIPYYARDGSIMFVCPNVKITIKKEGMMPYGFLFCELGVKPKTTADAILPFIQMIPKLSLSKSIMKAITHILQKRRNVYFCGVRSLIKKIC